MNVPKLWDKRIGDKLKPTYHIVQLKGKRGVWYLDYMHDGKRTRRSLSTRSKAEANSRRKIWINYCNSNHYYPICYLDANWLF